MDAFYSTIVTPNVIIDLLCETKTISFQDCMTQLLVGHLLGGAEILLLVVMAYDLYVAICKHLYYLIIMNQWVHILLLMLAWVGEFLHVVVQLVLVYNLTFCGFNVIDHLICDIYPLLKLAYVGTYIIGLTVIGNERVMCPMESLFTSWKLSVKKRGAKRYPAVAPTLLWRSYSLCPVFLCMWDHLLSYPLINHWLCSVPLSPSAESCNVYSEKWRDEDCHEKPLDQKKKMKQQKNVLLIFNEKLLILGKSCVSNDFNCSNFCSGLISFVWWKHLLYGNFQ